MPNKKNATRFAGNGRVGSRPLLLHFLYQHQTHDDDVFTVMKHSSQLND